MPRIRSSSEHTSTRGRLEGEPEMPDEPNHPKTKRAVLMKVPGNWDEMTDEEQGAWTEAFLMQLSPCPKN